MNIIDIAIKKGWVKPATDDDVYKVKLKFGQTRKELLLRRLSPAERKERTRQQKLASYKRISEANRAKGLAWNGRPLKGKPRKPIGSR